MVEGQYAGDADYNAATWVALAGITVAKGDQNFSWPASAYGGLVPTMTFGGSNLALANTPSAGEGATRYRISAASSPSDACSVDNSGTLTPKRREVVWLRPVCRERQLQSIKLGSYSRHNSQEGNTNLVLAKQPIRKQSKDGFWWSGLVTIYSTRRWPW